MPRKMGIDFGERRIGIALSDPTGSMAMPFETITITGWKDGIKQIKAICEAQDVDEIVVGLPLNLNGTRGELAEKASGFGTALAEKVQLPVASWDERLSSAEIERMIRGTGAKRKDKGIVDRLAAQRILQSWMDGATQFNSSTPPEEEIPHWPDDDDQDWPEEY